MEACSYVTSELALKKTLLNKGKKLVRMDGRQPTRRRKGGEDN